MRLLLSFVTLLLLLSTIQQAAAQSGDPSEMFLNAYMAVQQGEKLERNEKNAEALAKLRYAASLLDQISTNFPDWQPLIVDYRKRKTAGAITRLEEVIALEGPGAAEPPMPGDIEGPLPAYEDLPSAPSVVAPGGGGRSLPEGNVDALEQATQSIRSRIQSLEAEVAQQRAQISELVKDKEELQGRLGDALAMVDKARTTEAEMKSQLSQMQTALENAQADADGEKQAAMEQRIARLTEALQQARDERDVADEFTRDLRERIGMVQAESEKKLAAVTAERDQALVALEKSRKSQEQVDKLMDENEMLLTKLEEAETTIKKFNEEVPKKDEQIAQLRLEVATAKEMLAKAQEESEEYQSSMADLKEQLDAANKNLAEVKKAGVARPEEIAELTNENELLRGIVLRQLKEQARRDQAKKLVLAELGKLEGKSDVLMNQLEYLGQPLVKLTEEERALFKDPQIELPEIEDPSAMEISIVAPKMTEEVESSEPTDDGASSLASFGIPSSPLGDSSMPVDSLDSALESERSPTVETTILPNVPEELMPLAREARDFFDRGQYREAEKTYEKMIAQAPTNVYILSNLGVVRFRSGKLRLAEEAFLKAIEFDPNDSFSRCTLGIVYYQQGKYDEAIDELTKALAVDPKNATAHNYLGITASQKGWQEAAQKEMETAIALDPNYADAYFNLAVIHATAQPPNREAARKYYEKALSLGAKPDPALASLLN